METPLCSQQVLNTQGTNYTLNKIAIYSISIIIIIIIIYISTTYLFPLYHDKPTLQQTTSRVHSIWSYAITTASLFLFLSPPPKAGLNVGAEYNNNHFFSLFVYLPRIIIYTTCHQKHKHFPNKAFFPSHISYVNAYHLGVNGSEQTRVLPDGCICCCQVPKCRLAFFSPPPFFIPLCHCWFQIMVSLFCCTAAPHSP